MSTATAAPTCPCTERGRSLPASAAPRPGGRGTARLYRPCNRSLITRRTLIDWRQKTNRKVKQNRMVAQEMVDGGRAGTGRQKAQRREQAKRRDETRPDQTRPCHITDSVSKSTRVSQGLAKATRGRERSLLHHSPWSRGSAAIHPHHQPQCIQTTTFFAERCVLGRRLIRGTCGQTFDVGGAGITVAYFVLPASLSVCLSVCVYLCISACLSLCCCVSRPSRLANNNSCLLHPLPICVAPGRPRQPTPPPPPPRTPLPTGQRPRSRSPARGLRRPPLPSRHPRRRSSRHRSRPRSSTAGLARSCPTPPWGPAFLGVLGVQGSVVAQPDKNKTRGFNGE